jgi:hypothetical protein
MQADYQSSQVDLRKLTNEESETLGACLRAAARGPFFPDWEFHALFGLQRDQVGAIADGWPKPAQPDGDVQLAVNNSLNNLIGYPHRCEKDWDAWIPVSRAELLRLFARWRCESPQNYYDSMQ